MIEIPQAITLCNLEVILMPNGEIICLGKTLGWFDKLESHLSVKEKKNEPTITK